MKRKPPTKAESARLAAVKRLPCIACVRYGTSPQAGITEAHHLLLGGRRIGHQATVSLCEWHHRAVPIYGCTSAKMTELWGPSLANGSKPFHAAFGSDQDLLDETNRLLSEQSVEAA